MGCVMKVTNTLGVGLVVLAAALVVVSVFFSLVVIVVAGARFLSTL